MAVYGPSFHPSTPAFWMASRGRDRDRRVSARRDGARTAASAFACYRSAAADLRPAATAATAGLSPAATATAGLLPAAATGLLPAAAAGLLPAARLLLPAAHG